MNKEFRLNLYLSYSHALSDIMHIVFGLTLYFVSDDLNLSILSMGLLYNTASIFRGVSGFISGILSDRSNFIYWIILFAILSLIFMVLIVNLAQSYYDVGAVFSVLFMVSVSLISTTSYSDSKYLLTLFY